MLPYVRALRPGMSLLLLLGVIACDAVEVASSNRLACYEFTPTNGTGIPVVDIHIPVDGPPIDVPPTGPEGWEGEHTDDGIVFRTPPRTPPPVPGGTSVRPREPRPIPIGGRLGPFRFCLDGNRRSGQMEFSHPPGANGAAVPNSPGAILDEQGNPIPPRPDGTIPIPKKDDIYCFDLTVKAPRDAGVRAVRFRIENPGSGDAFVFGASPQPPPWTVNATGSSLAAFGVGGQDPIPPGGTRTVRVCTTKKNLRISWELEDTSGNPLPNESGEIQLNHS